MSSQHFPAVIKECYSEENDTNSTRLAGLHELPWVKIQMSHVQSQTQHSTYFIYGPFLHEEPKVPAPLHFLEC